jgi:hypothetical protein
MVFRRSVALFAVIVTCAVGCSDPYAGRQGVSGKVTLAGQPLKAGSITFFPMENQGTQSGAGIENGAYTVPRQSGLKPGKYRIEITAGDGRTPSNEEAGNPGGSTNIVSVDLVPEDWNTKSKKEVEVKATGPNTFDFEIPNLNPRARRR